MLLEAKAATGVAAGTVVGEIINRCCNNKKVKIANEINRRDKGAVLA
jgi:hypothetical protein